MWFSASLLCVLLQSVVSLKDDSAPCDGIEIVSRKEWRARAPVRFKELKLPLNHVIIQHTTSYPCKTKPQCIRNIQFIQDYHLDYKGWGDIAYNFLIGGDGRVYEGVGWRIVGSHSINFNTLSLGIAFIGDYSNVVPSQKMLNATLDLIECGVQEGYLRPRPEIHGHRDVACTDSPGNKLYAIIRQWDNYKGGRLTSYDCSGF
nr:BLTX341 [Nephila pilipes]